MNAVKPSTDTPVTEPETKAAAEEAALHNNFAVTNAAPNLDTNAPGQEPKAGAGDTNSSPDLSSLTHEQLEARIKTLQDNLASANAESESFREQWQELKLRDEALGVEALTVDESKLEDKLVQAVKELYQSEMKRREALLLLDKLLTTTGQMIQTAPNYDPKVRADYEAASRAAKDYLAGRSGAAIPIGESLSEGRISDVNPQLSTVILNLGKTQGVKEGMPFLIYQNNVEVGTAKVVMARDLISAALVQNLRPNVVLKVGDKVSVAVGQ